MEHVELEHQSLHHLGKRNREPPLDSDESMSEEEIVRTVGAHLIPRDNLALVRGVPVLEIIIDNQMSV
ncbi:hypothetical protein KI387_016665, partial [Taxus chinensis]